MALVIFIVILVALIWVHELGHFSAAKFFGVRVDEFAIGFPPRLVRVKWGETEYSFNLLLVGGYVKIFGENPDEGTGDPSTGSGRDPRALTSKNRGVQAAVLLAGIAFNLVFAWLALSAGYLAGIRTDHSRFGTVSAPEVLIRAVRQDSPAERAGLKAGDSIERVQTGAGILDTATLGTNRRADAVQQFIREHEDESLIFAVTRNGEEKTFLAKAEEGIVEGRKLVGIEFGDVGTLKLPPHLALLEGAVAFKDMTVATAQGLGAFLGQLALGRADFSQVAGPIGIAGVGSAAVAMGFGTAATVAALISINLALINLLPIPGLDGGRLLIVVIEALIRRPVSPRVTNALMFAGLAFIVVLMVAVSIHDIARLVG